MPSACGPKRRGSRKNRKNSRKSSRKASRRANRRRASGNAVSRNNMYGGEAPVDYSNPGPMEINLAQGEQFAKFHEGQHGGGALVGGPFPGAVTEGAFNPQGLMASARQDPLIQAYAEIKQYGPSSDNPNLRGGKRRRRGSRKSRQSRKSRKVQRGGVLIRWGGSRKSHRKSRKGSRGSRKYRGGAFSGGLNNPMPVSDEGKMLIPENLLAQSGQNAEWALAKDPMAFAPIATK